MDRYRAIKEAYDAGAAGHFTAIVYAAALGFALFLASTVATAAIGREGIFSLGAAKRTLVTCRFLMLCLWWLQLPLLYMVLFLSPPVLMPITYLGRGMSWIFGWGRTLTGLLLMPLGFFSNVHTAFRATGLLIVAIQYVMDAFSAITLAEYNDCMTSEQCTLKEDYTMQLLRLYYYRDLLCVLLDMSLMFFYGYFFIVFGCASDHEFTYAERHGYDEVKAKRLNQELAKLRRQGSR